jgi:hypothetical protein
VGAVFAVVLLAVGFRDRQAKGGVPTPLTP